jgi:hypothetical protein
MSFIWKSVIELPVTKEPGAVSAVTESARDFVHAAFSTVSRGHFTEKCSSIVREKCARLSSAEQCSSH